MKKITSRLALLLALAAVGGVAGCSDGSQPVAPITPAAGPSFDGTVQQDTVKLPLGGGATTESDTTCRGGTVGSGGGRTCSGT